MVWWTAMFLPETAISADPEEKDIAGRVHPVGQMTLRQGGVAENRVSDVTIRVGEQVMHGKTFSKERDHRRQCVLSMQGWYV